MEKISKEYAKKRAREFWDYLMNNNYEKLCFEIDGLHWQIYLDEDDEDMETLIISVEGYSEEHCDWVCRGDVAEIIYEFLNR